MKVSFDRRGFSSIVEITLVMGILTIIFGIGLISFPRIQQSTNISTVVETFLADFKEQQIKAMTGDADAGALPDYYGIKFDTSSYTLFKGATPSADPDRFTINIPSSIEITTGFKIIIDEYTIYDKQLLFFSGSGQVVQCCTTDSVITFKDVNSNLEKTISVNKLGAYVVY